MKLKFLPPPTKTIVQCDWDAIAAHVEKHGSMLLDLSVSWSAGHVALHHRGLGMRKVVVGGEHLGWSIQPVRKKQPKPGED